LTPAFGRGDSRRRLKEKLALVDDLAGVFGYPVDLVDLQVVAGPILQQALSTGVVLLVDGQSECAFGGVSEPGGAFSLSENGSEGDL